MEIEKLEKLSCLKIADNHREKISKSLDGIMDMLHDVEKISVPIISKVSQATTTFRQTVLTHTSKESLHLEEGLFLAPKVIKKD